MNVIITNKNQSSIQTLNMEIIKEMNGEFSADEIVAAFKNFFYQRMILDITALKDFKELSNLQKLSISLDMDKLILFLGNVEIGSSNEFLSSLISMGIYNFTKNVDGIMYLYNNPNSYRDVAHFHNLDIFKEEVPTATHSTKTLKEYGTQIIGIENVTVNSGATTLTYLMKRQLESNYSVIAIEMNKRDFSYFNNEKEMYSSTDDHFLGLLSKHADKDVILIDLNGSKVAKERCNDVIYLIEPSIIKLNKLMVLYRSKLQDISKKKIILNQSMLTSKDVLDFEYEARSKVFFNMPPLDERQKNILVLNMFLKKLGFDRQYTENSDKKSKILGIFNINN